MPATADQIAVIRSYVGAEPDDEALSTRYDRLGDEYAVAAEVLRERIADLQAGPTKLTVEGDYSVDVTESLRSLRESLADAERKVDPTAVDTPLISTGELIREDWER